MYRENCEDPHAVVYITRTGKVVAKVISQNQRILLQQAALKIETYKLPRPVRQGWLNRLLHGKQSLNGMLQYLHWLYRELGITDNYLIVMDEKESYFQHNGVEFFITDDNVIEGGALEHYREFFDHPLIDYWEDMASFDGHVTLVQF